MKNQRLSGLSTRYSQYRFASGCLRRHRIARLDERAPPSLGCLFQPLLPSGLVLSIGFGIGAFGGRHSISPI